MPRGMLFKRDLRCFIDITTDGYIGAIAKFDFEEKREIGKYTLFTREPENPSG